MRRTGRTRIAILAVLVLLAWLGPTWADCACLSAPATQMSGCHGESAPEIHPACCGGQREAALPGNCCGQVRAAAPATSTPNTAPAPSSAQLSSTSSATPAERELQDAAPVRLSSLPPPIYADVGLYTLHAVFLI